MKIEIASSASLSAAAREKVESFVRGKFGADAEPEYSVDPTLLGGIRIRAGERVYDGTLAARLSALGRKL